jgi:GT2 family glycosyltransferase
MSQQQSLPQVDIVFLAYNSEKWIAPCLASLEQITYPKEKLSIIFVDNASSDASVAEFEKWQSKQSAGFAAIQVKANKVNEGCAGGNNIGWRMGEAPYVLFLNLDTELDPNFLEPLVGCLEENPEAGFAGPKIYFPDSKRLQHAGGQVYSNGMADHHFNNEEDKGQADDEREVDYLTGACLLARRTALEQLDGLDEDFNPAYYEETDLCWRGRLAGWSSHYVPRSLIIHHETAGLGGRTDPRFLRAIYRNRMRFVVKHWTLADLFERWLPTERWWFTHIESKTARPYQWRSYTQALGFILQKFCKDTMRFKERS